MNRLLIAAIFSSLLLMAGCASVGPSATVVTAKKVVADGDAPEVSDVFAYGENVVAFVTVDGEPAEGREAPTTIQARWYNDDKLVAARKRGFSPTRMPHTAWFQVPAATLGAGACRVEIYLDDRLAASRDFTIADR